MISRSVPLSVNPEPFYGVSPIRLRRRPSTMVGVKVTKQRTEVDFAECMRDREIAAWVIQRNEAKARIKWMFNTEKAHVKFSRAYLDPAKEP
jgi:hypothetical protein